MTKLKKAYRTQDRHTLTPLVQELAADALIIDEPAGREAAKRQGVRVIGTLRVLYDAAADRAHPDCYSAFLDMHSQR